MTEERMTLPGPESTPIPPGEVWNYYMAAAHRRIDAILGPLIQDVYRRPYSIILDFVGSGDRFTALARFQQYRSLLGLPMPSPLDELMIVSDSWECIHADGFSVVPLAGSWGNFPTRRGIVLWCRSYGRNATDGQIIRVFSPGRSTNSTATFNLIEVAGQLFTGRSLDEARRRARELTHTPSRHLLKQIRKLGPAFKAAIGDGIVMSQANKHILLDMLLEKEEYASLAEQVRKFCPELLPETPLAAK